MKKKSFLSQEEYPYIIEADTLLEDTAFPTHTHGLSDIGWPEFIMDPLAFGGEGNAGLINATYRHFKNNMNDLQAVLNGSILKYPINTIAIGWRDAPIYTICFRLVPNTFEAVKEAYGDGVVDVVPAIEFIQIWIDGDYFTLTDEYYRGGVKW